MQTTELTADSRNVAGYPSGESATRAYWVALLDRIARPVLTHLADGTLRAKMPVEARPEAKGRADCTHLEALGRTLVGLAPFLELPPDDTLEGKVRAELADLARRALIQATDPQSPDFLNFSTGQQPLVDMGFLAQSLLRAPQTLWHALDAPTQDRVVAALLTSRTRKPGFNNWLLFCGTIEAFLLWAERGGDPMRIDYALRQHEQWYKGDGVYGDGPTFHWDYYNAFVIQPMLVDMLRAVAGDDSPWKDWQALVPRVTARARRYAEVQERMISPEGTFPPLGRSLCYRFGALQGLAQAALLHNLPNTVPPASARCALTAVIRRMAEATGTFDTDGWLRLGFCGAQPSLAETYISTGSLYLCTAGLLPLGLPASDPFWSDTDALWTSARLWSGQDGPTDHAISE